MSTILIALEGSGERNARRVARAPGFYMVPNRRQWRLRGTHHAIIFSTPPDPAAMSSYYPIKIDAIGTDGRHFS
jgi:hypothetical protein